ncbi:MAG: transcription-repair coupling factor [Deltaproteobacteria bacterium]|jgi:transcription-repair coupling factor (superfamily II helicase)|nr:transcription-repair coupling factor [Deltaproteobacteria bacterium]
MDQAFDALIETYVHPSGSLPPVRSISRSGPGTKARLALGLLARGKAVVMLLRDQSELAEMRALLTLLDPESSAGQAEIAPPWKQRLAHLAPSPPLSGNRAARGDNLATLYSLRHTPLRCLLLTPDALLLHTPPADIFDQHVLRLYRGMDMPTDLILDQLAEWGYARAGMVGEPGEFAVRGDILDLFPPGYARPVRLEFFGDTLEDLRSFDPSSQRSSLKLEEITLLPFSGIILSPRLLREAEERWKALAGSGRLDSDNLYMLRKDLDAGGHGLLPGMYYERPARLEDWLDKDPVFILPGRSEVGEMLRAAAENCSSFLEAQRETGLCQPRALVLRPESEALAWLETKGRLHFEDLRVGVEDKGENLPERSINSFQELFPSPADAERPWHCLVRAMRRWSGGKNGTVLLSFAGERSRAKFLDLAGQDGIAPLQRYAPGRPGLYALLSPFRRGLILGEKARPLLGETAAEDESPLQGGDAFMILGEDVLQPHSARSRSPAAEAFKGLNRYDELREGDFLVHRDYGICAFGGLQRLQLEEAANDFLLLRYAGDDKLYLPVDRLGLIRIFKAPDEVTPALDRLGSLQWAGSKEKARRAIEKIAEDLVEMYAYRKVAKGYNYSPPGELYREFEATFGFEETPDQARAIEDVLADMSRPEPMDRLICGDVGFGKTEVALRAAFRAALDGRQSVLLCPTTVLAEQHYQTFRSRLAGFPLNVGILSRFVPRGRQREVLRGVARGQVDILIGTHRLLSRDVSLPNLGLIILDEEQRFGVRHKELLKHMKKNVDVLTLTATPIPRTLQLSLSGIRELSVMETPPSERKPVATALIDRDEGALRAVVRRELARQGQVFWVHNRVQGLERAAEYVRKLAPEVRIGIAHGQMNEKALEEAMLGFWHGDLDVLVCTSIIESGLDFPQANTLVVDQAHLFGLGQLYQLRGRVGRSDRQAFAVFVCNDVDKLEEAARKRLRVILDLDYLGAGTQVAMEDLRLRGAGNILGESQSGHLNRLGLDFFLEMLEEAVSRLRGKPRREKTETELNLGIPAHIPESYIADSRERLRYYKILSSAADPEARRETEFELRDRFGPIPPELENFFSVLNFKQHLADWGVSRADIHQDSVRLYFDRHYAGPDPRLVVDWVQKNKDRAKLHPPSGLDFSLRGGDMPEKLALACVELAFVLRPEQKERPQESAC